MKLGTFRSSALVLAGSLLAAAAVAQNAGNPGDLGIPADAEVFGDGKPVVHKATAIVNGYVLTGTDIAHRMALLVFPRPLSSFNEEDMGRLRAQVLRNLIDETLQIQAAEAEEIEIEQRMIDAQYARIASSLELTPEVFAEQLKAAGSSEASIKRQIRGQLAWARLQNRMIEPFVAVGEEEVEAIIDRLNAAKGEQEYNVSEIFLAATSETAPEALSRANQIVEQIRRGYPFVAAAQQHSEASTKSVGGDLSWVRPEQLPDALAEAVRALPTNQVSNPIPVPGGYSILLVKDKRQFLVSDERDAVLNLKQMSISFPPGTSEAQAQPAIQRLVQTAQTMGGCGRAEEAAAAIGATVITSDQTKVRDLPPLLQDMMLSLSIGQATSPFGTLEDGVRILVLCGRDDPVQASGPTFTQVSEQLLDQRVNMRAQRYLRDLRRDAVVDYR